MSPIIEGIVAKEAFRIGSLPITTTVVMTWILMGIIITFAYFATRNLRDVPQGAQNYMEVLLDFIWGMLRDMMGEKGRPFLPLIATLAMFVTFGNLMGIVPLLDSPTSDLNTDLALGLMIFFVCQVVSMRNKGILGYLKSFFDPVWYVPIFFILNVAGMMGSLISHSFRLFGNMVGGAVVMAMIFYFVPVVVPGVVSIYYDVFASLIQGVIFFMLAIAYIVNAS